LQKLDSLFRYAFGHDYWAVTRLDLMDPYIEFGAKSKREVLVGLKEFLFDSDWAFMREYRVSDTRLMENRPAAFVFDDSDGLILMNANLLEGEYAPLDVVGYYLEELGHAVNWARCAIMFDVSDVHRVCSRTRGNDEGARFADAVLVAYEEGEDYQDILDRLPNQHYGNEYQNVVINNGTDRLWLEGWETFDKFGVNNFFSVNGIPSGFEFSYTLRAGVMFPGYSQDMTSQQWMVEFKLLPQGLRRGGEPGVDTTPMTDDEYKVAVADWQEIIRTNPTDSNELAYQQFVDDHEYSVAEYNRYCRWDSDAKEILQEDRDAGCTAPTFKLQISFRTREKLSFNGLPGNWKDKLDNTIMDNTLQFLTRHGVVIPFQTYASLDDETYSGYPSSDPNYNPNATYPFMTADNSDQKPPRKTHTVVLGDKIQMVAKNTFILDIDFTLGNAFDKFFNKSNLNPLVAGANKLGGSGSAFNFNPGFYVTFNRAYPIVEHDGNTAKKVLSYSAELAVPIFGCVAGIVVAIAKAEETGKSNPFEGCEVGLQIGSVGAGALTSIFADYESTISAGLYYLQYDTVGPSLKDIDEADQLTANNFEFGEDYELQLRQAVEQAELRYRSFDDSGAYSGTGFDGSVEEYLAALGGTELKQAEENLENFENANYLKVPRFASLMGPGFSWPLYKWYFNQPNCNIASHRVLSGEEVCLEEGVQ
ncbi:MAG: hypothetical protein DWQ08_00565, partial [Proteobacteria bacterium]